ncbi:MAG: helix-turn-helix domain-containing protein [Candidatus Entotheonellia bacterium]
MAHGHTSPSIIFLSPAEQAQLEHWQRSTTIQAGLAKRASVVLLRVQGLALSEIGRRLAVGRRIVRTWLKRLLNQRVAGLSDQPGRGRQPVFSPRGGRCIWLSWPASDRIDWAAPSPSRIAWNWRGN